MRARIPPHVIPRIYFLLLALERVPYDLRIEKNGRITFSQVIASIKRNDRDFYNKIMEVYGCRDEACLKMRMAKTYTHWVARFLTLGEEELRVGVIHERLREKLQRIIPLRV